MSLGFHMPDGELRVQWVVREHAADAGFTVDVAIGDHAYSAKKDPALDATSKARLVRNVLVSAIEYELSQRMGLLP